MTIYSNNQQHLPPTTVAVTPVELSLAEFDLAYAGRVTVQLDNLNSTQTFTGSVYRRLGNGWAPTAVQDFMGVQPSSSVMVDLDVVNTRQLKLTGAMSGAGGDVSISMRRKDT